MVTQIATERTEEQKLLHKIFLQIEQIEFDSESAKNLAQIGQMSQNCGLADLDYSAQFEAIFDRVINICKSIADIKTQTENVKYMIT